MHRILPLKPPKILKNESCNFLKRLIVSFRRAFTYSHLSKVHTYTDCHCSCCQLASASVYYYSRILPSYWFINIHIRLHIRILKRMHLFSVTCTNLIVQLFISMMLSIIFSRCLIIKSCMLRTIYLSNKNPQKSNRSPNFDSCSLD